MFLFLKMTLYLFKNLWNALCTVDKFKKSYGLYIIDFSVARYY